jgi:RNA recognition motif-containing protein
MANDSYLDSKIGFFNKDVSMTTIYVGNLSFEKTELDIKELFESYGKVTYVKLIKDEETHNSKGIAFLQMPHKKEAKLALAKLNGATVDDRELKVSEAIDENKPQPKKRKKPYKAYIAKKDRVQSEE